MISNLVPVRSLKHGALFKHGSIGQGEKYITRDVIYHRQNLAELDSLFVPMPLSLGVDLLPFAC